MTQLTVEPFNIIGISVRTNNNSGDGSLDIPALWNKFIVENVIEKIPNKIDNTVYSIYHEYESDYTKPYTAMLGCKVSSLDDVPEGLVSKQFAGGTYNKFVVTGNIFEGIIFKEWLRIWSLDLDRSYTYDFEVYGEKAKNPSNAEVEIFIAVKN